MGSQASSTKEKHVKNFKNLEIPPMQKLETSGMLNESYVKNSSFSRNKYESLVSRTKSGVSLGATMKKKVKVYRMKPRKENVKIFKTHSVADKSKF